MQTEKPQRTRKTHSEAEQYWKKVILSWQRSGEKVKQYCEKNKVHLSSFYDWRRRLFPDLTARRQKKAPSKKNVQPWYPVKVIPVPKKTLTLHLPKGCSVDLNQDFDVLTLTRLIDALGESNVHASRR